MFYKSMSKLREGGMLSLMYQLTDVRLTDSMQFFYSRGEKGHCSSFAPSDQAVKVNEISDVFRDTLATKGAEWQWISQWAYTACVHQDHAERNCTHLETSSSICSFRLGLMDSSLSSWKTGPSFEKPQC